MLYLFIMNDRVIEIFWKHIVKGKAGECWGWGGELGKRDTPLIRIYENGKRQEYYPRQISLQLHNQTLHKRVESICKNKLCLNPDHLASGDEARFWAKVYKFSEAKGGCWIWTGSEHHFGHGAFSYFENGKKVQIYASRYSWELHYGKLSSPVVFVCHKCDNPRCVNPEHLFIGLTQDNTKDRDEKGRTAHPKGEQNAMSKVTEKDVLIMREIFDAGVPKNVIYKMYESVIGKTGIHLIVTRKTWKHIP
jgi:hypothetical protein